MLRVASFGLDGKVQELAQKDLSAVPYIYTGANEIAYDGRRVLASFVRFNPVAAPELLLNYSTLYSFDPSTSGLDEYLGESSSPNWGYAFPLLFDNGRSSVFAGAGMSILGVDAAWAIYQVTDAGYVANWVNTTGSVTGYPTAMAAFENTFFVLNTDGILVRITGNVAEDHSLGIGSTYGALRAQSAGKILLIVE